jgi:predicted ester cyclase
VSAKALVERYLAEVLGGSPAADPEVLVADDELLRRTETMRDAFPDLVVEVCALLAEDDLVAAHFSVRGTHLGLFRGVPPTGRRWEGLCTAVYRVERARIVESWTTWDTLSLMEQLGAVQRTSTVSA